jgi:hypothetical protein
LTHISCLHPFELSSSSQNFNLYISHWWYDKFDQTFYIVHKHGIVISSHLILYKDLKSFQFFWNIFSYFNTLLHSFGGTNVLYITSYKIRNCNFLKYLILLCFGPTIICKNIMKILISNDMVKVLEWASQKNAMWLHK